jgi:hypothetical protein
LLGGPGEGDEEVFLEPPSLRFRFVVRPSSP